MMPHFFSRVAALFLASGHFALTAVAHTYHSPMAGACRGPGGADDKVNMKVVHERSEADCMADCDAEAHCKGWAYHPSANGGECMVYGPGMAGSCSDASVSSPTACAALGTCANPTFTSQETCGTCSQATAITVAACAAVVGTWTELTWTSSGATWEDSEDPWTGEYWESTIVTGVTASAGGYECYDVDNTDHHATCDGTSTTNVTCADAFTGVAEADMIADNCPSGCTFTAEVSGPSTPTVPHDVAIQSPGYEAWIGACRGPGGNKANGKYTNTAGPGGETPTQLECQAFCDAEPACVAYAHGSWCLNYGPGIEGHCDWGGSDCPADNFWYSDSHAATTVVGTNGNVAYLCVVKVDAESNGAKGSTQFSAFVLAAIAITSFIMSFPSVL